MPIGLVAEKATPAPTDTLHRERGPTCSPNTHGSGQGPVLTASASSWPPWRRLWVWLKLHPPSSFPGLVQLCECMRHGHELYTLK